VTDWESKAAVVLTLNEYDSVLWLLRQRIEEIEDDPNNANDDGAKKDIENVQIIIDKLYNQIGPLFDEAVHNILSNKKV
jgi:hypothetical protein